VGAGPGGALLSWHLARDGAAVTVFDASHPREKPCGGGVTARALDLLPPGPADDPLPARFIEACRFESSMSEGVDVPLRRPVAVAARRDLDAWLLRRALAVGAVHVAERVTEVDGTGRVRTAAGTARGFDVVVGADGAGSLVRRTLLGPTPKERLVMAAGWFARGTSPMLIRFVPELTGYLWLFPRPGHVGVGICAPLAGVPTKQMLDRLEREVAVSFPALLEDDGGRYAHTIPSPSADPRSILESAGARWALVGDAAALADPITGEGIFFALRSAAVLAQTLRETGSPVGYPARALEDFGRELNKAAALRDRFYSPGLSRRVVAYAGRSRAIRSVLGDLVLGEQGYLSLKRRLLRAGPRFLLESAASRIFPAA
jgi:geranylgeranyl diphosphate/geranylgeranyl-bacteriochlorophyllide a reductase